MVGTGLPCGLNCSCEDTGLIAHHLAASEAMVLISPRGELRCTFNISELQLSPGTGLCSDYGLRSGDAAKSPALGGGL